MKQNNVIVHDLDELKNILPSLQKSYSTYNYKDGVIEVSVGNIPKEDVKKALDLVGESFPQMRVIGYSSAQQTLRSGLERSISLVFTFLDKSDAEPFYMEADFSDDFLEKFFSYAKEMNARIRKMKNVKAIEIYFAYLKSSATKFMRILTDGLEDVQVFGVVAAACSNDNVNDYFNDSREDTFVIGGKSLGPGVSGVIYSGDDLFVYTDYLFGWEPVGRYMEVVTDTVTDQENIGISTIDGVKATDIYKKYLGVEPNKYFTLNISAFPLVIERDGLLIGRTPSAYGDNGEVYVEGEVFEGEKVRFSYAETEAILNNTKNASCRMRAFGAEKLSLIICGNRYDFLQENYHLEVDYYAEGREQAPNVISGLGEIYMLNGKGGILNSALVAVGMREGLKGEVSSTILKPDSLYHYHDIIPLSQRLSHFLSAMTGELVDAVHAAKAANNAKSDFLSSMSHEIRTPINSVLGMDEMILRESDDVQILEYAQNIKNAGNTLLGLINDILDFSKIEAGKMDIIPVEYDFSSVFNDLIHLVKPRVEAKRLEFIADIDKNIPSVLYGDEIRIKQVVTNLLSNAVKYTEKGSITISVDYKKISEDTVDFIVAVRDTGIGIKESDIKRLFSAFQRVDEVHNRTIQGTGLGLNITKRLLNQMGSELKVKSEYGKGSEFYFTLRQKVVKWDPVGDYVESYKMALMARKAYKEKFTAPNARILVVDDTPMNLSVFKGLLKKTLVNIDEAESGMQCLKMTGKKKYDLIFLDHRMPDMDGVETLEAMKKDPDNPNKDIPVICLTANAVSGAREYYINSGFTDYITKPIVADKLESMIINYLPKEKVKLDSAIEDEDDTAGELPKWLEMAEGIDREEGLKNCGSSEMYISAVSSFANAAEENYRAIEGFMKAGSIADYTIKVHALKSSARIIGALQLSRLAEDLEKAGDEKNIDKINEVTPDLLVMYRKIFEGLKDMNEAPEDLSLPLMDEAQLKDALTSIKELSQSYDYDSIKYIIDTINSYRFPEGYAERILRLKEAVRNADWDKINKALDES